MSAELFHLVQLIARQDASTAGEAGEVAGGTDGAAAEAAEEDVCAASNFNDRMGLRIGAIFVILVRLIAGEDGSR
jgi:hypothetical protein